MNFYNKYIKYKKKYLKLKYKNLIGGTNIEKQRKINFKVNLEKRNKQNKRDLTWRTKLPAFGHKFIDNNNNELNPFIHEIYDQYFTAKWINKNDIVLELGGRFGIVSCTINYILNPENKKKHVVIEPDSTVIDALKKNKKKFKAQFSICEQPISNNRVIFNRLDDGLANYITQIGNSNSIHENEISTINSIDFFTKYPQKFNVLVADCEGCICNFLEENPILLSNLELIIFEKDNSKQCNYIILTEKLNKQFRLVDFIKFKDQTDNHYEVWVKKDITLVYY